jgi:hypothetical protein
MEKVYATLHQHYQIQSDASVPRMAFNRSGKMKTGTVSFVTVGLRFKFVWLLQVAAALASSACLGQNNPAQISSEAERMISLGAEADMNSRYIWRGIIFEDNPVAQPSLWASFRSLTLSLWSNHVLGQEIGVGIGDEIDFTVAHEHDWRLLTSGLEFAYYLYPGEDESPATGEFTLSVSRSIGLLTASTRHTFDVLEYRGAYFGDASLSFEHEPLQGLDFEMKALAGWASAEFNEAYIGISRSALNLAGMELAATIRVAGPLYVRPHAEACFILDHTIADVARPHVTNAGLAIGVE